MAMGSPLAATLAILVMDDLIETCFSTADLEIAFFTKYVDDLIFALRDGTADTVMSIFNDYGEHIRFTTEHASNGGISFLDTYLRIDEGGLAVDWYSKPIASNRMLNYRSCHSFKTKMDVAYGLIEYSR